MKKQIVAGALAAALCLSPALAAFDDVADPQVRQAVDILAQLEVVNGKPDGTFDPDGVFTRAEFCKMALVALDRAQEAQLNLGRVIFTDVTAGHWALGYVNAAAAVKEGATPLVQGRGDGSFAPDAPITSGEAVTILMRSLGYTDADVGGEGGTWYAGHMLRAKTIGLLDGLPALTGAETLTRSQAALLFENLLYTEMKDSTKLFLEEVLKGSIGESQLVLEVKGKALASGGWSVKTDKGSYVTFSPDLDSALRGRRCQPILDVDGNVLALRIDEDYTTQTLRILSAEARYLVTEGDSQLLVPAATPVWKTDGTQSAYSEVYKEIPYGASAVLCYDKTDTLASIYLTGRSSDDLTAVAKEGSGPFDGAWEDQPTAVYKNGVSTSLAAVKPYDVGTFDPISGVLEVSDRKVTGVFEDAAPSPVSPNTVTVMGCAFPVLDCALKDLAHFTLGDRVTLLLDGDSQVAGVVSADTVSAKVFGTAVITKGEPDVRGYDTYQATVKLAWGPTLKGEVRQVGQYTIQNAPGKLWAVSSSRSGILELSTPSSAGIDGAWDVKAGHIGSVRVSPKAAVYDKIDGGHLTQVDLESVTMPVVPAARIELLELDNAGAAQLIVLKDCTGEGYTYGRVSFRPGSSSGTAMSESIHPVTTVTNGKDALALTTSSNYSALKDHFMGLAPSLSKSGEQYGLGASVELTAAYNVPRSAFGETTVTVGGVVYPLAGNIDNCCFNSASETWFDSLDSALAYASSLTVYFDKAPDQGGKVRLVATP